MKGGGIFHLRRDGPHGSPHCVSGVMVTSTRQGWPGAGRPRAVVKGTVPAGSFLTSLSLFSHLYNAINNRQLTGLA